MSQKYETPTLEALVVEQESAQVDKFQGRLIDEYSRHIFPGQDWREPRSSAVTDFLRPICTGERVSLKGVINGLCEANIDNPVRWVDMGGGRGLSMRQLATDVAISKHLSMTNVDLFDYGFIGLEPDELTYLENLIPDVTHQLAAPHFILANAETVLLPEPADLITSVQVIQYLNNPLAAISNWYNQLADNGLLIISTEHDWASWIRYQREPGQGDQDEVPTKHLLQTLKMAGVSFATSDDIDSASGYRPDPDCNHRIKNLVIQKAPNTQLIVNSPLSEVWVNHYDFKAAYYAEPGPDFRSIVEIIKA